MSTQTNAVTDLLGQLADLLDGIDPAADSRPTPCTDYDVAALRAHVVGWLTAFTDGFSAADGQCSDAEAVVIDGRGGAQVRALADRLGAALDAGAGDRPLRIGDSEMPGEMALAMILWEYQVHGWDLAVATGQDWQPADAALEASLQFAPMMLTPDYQGEGKAFAPRVEPPAGADAMTRLACLSGRQPVTS